MAWFYLWPQLIKTVRSASNVLTDCREMKCQSKTCQTCTILVAVFPRWIWVSWLPLYFFLNIFRTCVVLRTFRILLETIQPSIPGIFPLSNFLFLCCHITPDPVSIIFTFSMSKPSYLVRQPRGEPCTGGPTTGFCRLCTYEPSLSGIRVVPSWHYWAFWENGPFPWQPSPKYEKLKKYDISGSRWPILTILVSKHMF